MLAVDGGGIGLSAEWSGGMDDVQGGRGAVGKCLRMLVSLINKHNANSYRPHNIEL